MLDGLASLANLVSIIIGVSAIMEGLFNVPFKELSSPRIKLEAISQDDVEDVFALYSDEESALLDDWSPLISIRESKSLISARMEINKRKEGLEYSIKTKANKFIGCCGAFDFDLENMNCSLFYQVLKDYRNKGYATEAVGLICKYCFKSIGIHRLYAYITPGNIASIKVLEKNGFRIEGVLRDMEYYKNQYWDGILMAKINDGEK